MTMISVATPSMMPMKEKPAMTEMKASRRRGAKVAPGDHPLETGERPRAGRQRFGRRLRRSPDGVQPLAPARSRLTAPSMLSVSRSPVARRLISTSPRCESLRPDDDLPGQADQVHGGELGAGALVEVIVEHFNSGIREALVEASAAASVAASPGLRLIRPTANGATLSGQMMPASSWLRLDDRADEARHADAVGAAMDRRARRRRAR